MPRQVIKINPYSEKSIDEAIKKLKFFKQEVQLKTVQLITKLAEIGIQTIDSNKYAEGDTNFVGEAYTQLEYGETSAKVTLVLHGEKVAFIEFGAGIHYNTPAGQSPNPFGQQLGFTIGSYGLGLGANDSWRYQDLAGNWKTSQGTKAQMPMAKADQAIRDAFEQTIEEVFK